MMYTLRTLKNFCVEFAVNSGPPSEANSSAILKVLNFPQCANKPLCVIRTPFYYWPVCIAMTITR